jgi:ribonuclease J
MIEVFAVGGFLEIGRNMTLIKYKDEAVIIDMGLHMDNYIAYTEDEDIEDLTAEELITADAVPDINRIAKYRKIVKAIIPTHAHLDHVGAIPFLSNNFKAPILCSGFTGAVLTEIINDHDFNLKNKIMTLNTNATYKISKNITVEFINMTHSTPDTVMVAIKTPEGTVLYCNDFKFDKKPILGDKPNIDKLKRLKNVKLLIIDSLYADREGKTPSESVARELLKDVVLGVNADKNAIIISTFSSHMARLKSIIECGKKLNRKVIFLGRSLSKYTNAAEKAGLVNFSDQVEIVKYGSKVRKRLKKIQKEHDRKKLMLVVTGHQAEPKAVLSKMVYNGFFDFKKDDVVVFSCKVIPNEMNEKNRKKLEKHMEKMNLRIFKDVHVSGHASREDHRDLINLVKPKHIIPAHADLPKSEAMKNLCLSMGYKDKNIHLLKEGDKLEIK